MEKTKSRSRRQFSNNTNNDEFIVSWHAFSCCGCLCCMCSIILQFSTTSYMFFIRKFIGSKRLSTYLTTLCGITLCKCSKIYLTYIPSIYIYIYIYSLSSFCLRLYVFFFFLVFRFFLFCIDFFSSFWYTVDSLVVFDEYKEI